jgi:SAM-dependent methyltransferase
MGVKHLQPTGTGPDPGRSEEWFRRAFDEFYLELYAHRDRAEAERLIRTLRARFGLSGPVLDLACGAGRFLSELGAAGVEAVGLDLSRPLLRQAQIVLREPPAGPARLVLADMRRLPIRPATFHWVLLLFTSFGYFETPEEDAGVLGEVARSLRPGGRVALDFFNPAAVAEGLVHKSRRIVAGREVRETRWIDPVGPFLRKVVEVAAPGLEAPRMTYQERVRLYSVAELEDHLARAGFALEARLGDYGGAPFSESSSPRCLLIGRTGEARPGGSGRDGAR